MKRVLLLLIMFFSITCLFSQNKYKIYWTLNIPNQNCNCKDGKKAGIRELIFKSSSDIKYIYDNEHQLWEAFGETIKGTVEMYASNNITFEIRTTSNIKNAQRDCTSEYIRTFNVEDITCPSKTFIPRAIKKKTFHADAACFELSFTFDHAEPLIDLFQNSNTIIGYDDPFNIKVASNSMGFSNTSYNWQYRIEGEWEWRDMPYWTMGKKNFDIVPNEFLNEDAINKKIRFRIKSCQGYTSNDEIFYDLRKSAPKIIGKDITQPKCYDSNGSVKLYFNRQLDSGDKISYVISDKTKPAGDIGGKPYYTPLFNENNLTSFTEENGEYFIEIDGLVPSDHYFFEMIGFGEGTEYRDEEEVPIAIEDSEYNDFPYYTDGTNHSLDITIVRPTPVEFSITGYTDVVCNGEDNGTISIKASGGNTTGTYKYQLLKEGAVYRDWTLFSSVNTSVISGLPKGNYSVKVQDANGCIAKEIERDETTGDIIGLGEEIEEAQIITEPLTLEASLIEAETKEPTAHGFTDGVISIEINGGNHNNIGYTVVWEKDRSIISNPNTESDSKEETDDSFTYTERLLDVGAGTYTATIEDSKGCIIIVGDIEIGQPEALSLIIDETQAISCNNASTNDEFDLIDGELTARGRGGVRLEAGDNGGKFYYYTWYEKNAQGEWIEMEHEKDSVLSGLSQGEYAVNIKDENGIIIGKHKDNALERPTNIEYELQEPDPIIISISLEDVYCKGGNNAWIEASITGGTLNPGETYRYEWSNGETTNRIENLYAGTYTLYVYDSNDCYTTREVVIDEPDKPLMVEEFAYKQPKATGLTDGYIQYKITGGTPKPNKTYNYQWTDSAGNNLNTQVTDSLGTNAYYIKLNGIGKGTYSLTVTDANYSKTDSHMGCTATDMYKLDEPDPLELIVVETKVISCNVLNEHGNPWADGELTAHAKGGVWLQSEINDGLRYYYTWKKKNANGTWRVLTSQTDSVAVNLDAGEYAVNIKDANGVILGNYGIDNELEEAIDTLYTLEEPPLLEISTTQQNVYCYAGSDAWAEVSITGGTAPYDIEWSNGDTTARATELSAKTYEVHVIDDRGCEAIAQVTITEPEAPVSISYPQYNRPTSIGANDAWIEAVVTGGTSFDDDTYTYFWEDEEGTLLNAQTSAETVDGSYVIRLKNITAGTYYLTAQDKNYGIATTKLGCTLANSEFVIDEPIEAVIEIEIPISCNTANEYQDPYSDGALVAHITGGVPFDSGLPYIYHWKKQNEAGQWEDLTDQLDSIALNLNDGNYALNVEDSKGTVMGRYSSDNLTKAIDSTFYFKEPDLLEVSFTTTEVNCDAGNDGSAKVHITGGTPPYTIKWSNGQTAQEIKKLIGGNYFVFVTDSRGCEVSGNVEVAQPGGIRFDVVVQKDPTCFEGNDGAIRMNITGGIPPYEYQWNTGGSTNSISNLSKGKYTLRVIDGQDCIAYKEIVLEDPEPVYIDLGEDRTLCDDQEFSLDIAIDDAGAGYYWESNNGFTSADPQVTLSKAGVYTATITTSLGCIGQDQIEIVQSNAAIDADFLITSQAFVGEEVVLVNVSSPLGEGTEWYVPDGVTVVSESNEAIILKFKKTRPYEVRLRTLEGDCYQDYTKQIVVEEPTELYDIGEAEQPFLKKFLIHPNPNDGNFTVEIELSETADVALRLISLLTADVSDIRTMINRDNYSESYSTALASGTYILLLETPKGNEVRRVIIK
ncbi:T9SS type A sorting domain-containing protein [Galbibacter pacificus]|uniref:T9SS type A sorting domain-containing protein n=1 Tax=Galbibacter pacificus TaxID=2996052 RepID=A0ABT6FWL1_9FLAO|nr:T9SS type A sorting domain-containing protein [Galbibacter pacificus]MDG3584166.1 T9SS type A sorting domain-containing protein [Galbibacter pacificus]MDG3587653.1 T9SS type A sorting domain-containing protein [Galbibacter pacificus]